jgi:anion-transporting  ArsA/GET3 family ATPase
VGHPNQMLEHARAGARAGSGPGARRMDDLLAHSLLVVAGKGGVGKSTMAAALGLAADRRGLRTIVVEVAARDDVSRALGAADTVGYGERAISERLHHISIDPQCAMEEYLRQQLPVGALASVLARSRIFGTLSAATPGLRELLTVGKVWELAQPERRGHGSRPYDLVVLDAPATGHALAMLRAPATFASVARVGPVATQGRAVAGFLGDARRTAVVAVCTPEEMPVAETLELAPRLREQVGLDLSLVVVNAVVPHRFTRHDERTLQAAPPSAAQHAALFAASWARRQRAHIVELRRGVGGVPVVTLPLVIESALDAAAVDQLSREFER